MRALGILIVVIGTLFPLYWFWPLAMRHDFWAVMSQYIGVAALILMSFSQLLATRFVVLEKIFGGLDRIYVLHKWLGILALGAVLLHDTIDADIDGLGQETALTELAETFGEFSLYSFLILGVISVVTFIPYHWWKLTHKFMGALFALSAFHYVFMIKPFELFDPVGIYTNAFCILGIACYLFTLLPNVIWRGRHSYIVQNVEKSGDALSVEISPMSRGLSHHAGQFAFVDFKIDGQREVHPFTISSAPRKDRSIRFSFKPLGDHTRVLAQHLKSGDAVKVSPAYGHFKRHRNSAMPEIWIAGGIGITPFLAFAGELKTLKAPIHLFYCVRDKSAATHSDELQAMANQHENFHLHLVESSKAGRLSADYVQRVANVNLASTKVYFCGAEQMRSQLGADLRGRGLSARNFRFEEFEIRQGIVSAQTMREFSEWAWTFVQQQLLRRRRS